MIMVDCLRLYVLLSKPDAATAVATAAAIADAGRGRGKIQIPKER